MTLRDLWLAYLTYPTILLYFALILGSAVMCLRTHPAPFAVLAPVAAVVAIYPIAWYAIHRFILHGQWLYRSRWTAALWKRIHFDHHQDPHLLDVLFGSPINTIPTIALITAPVGYLIGGAAGAWAGLAAGFATTCVYEFFHCIQHLAYKPRWGWVARMKQLHVLHHFHDEDGNYGITNYLPDRLFGSYYGAARDRGRSASVFNLGYDLTMAGRFPWVMKLTGAPPRDRPAGSQPPRSTPPA
ncbi:sterol desaturase family protein [Tanticharoenia sakaeratensis]|nr:sterol desaturase family protein [Tanticharoenia sakaeratensis]